jgi:hypothetical protein
VGVAAPIIQSRAACEPASRQYVCVTDGGAKPSWRDWRWLPPSLEQQQIGPLSKRQLWGWWLGWPAVIVVHIVLWQLSDAIVLLVGLLIVPFQWLSLTPSQRRQVLGRTSS